LQLFKCVSESSHDEAPQRSDCDGDWCSQLESGNYRISDSHADFQPLAFFALLPVVFVQFPVDEQPGAVIKAPPEIPCRWQFIYRTALPPRAPSFVS
jgi:hypothetical protein